MEEKKAEVTAKWREVSAQMRVISFNKINYKTRYPIVFEKVEALFASLIVLYDELFDKIADGDEMKTEQERCTQQEAKIREFLLSL